MYEIPPHIVHAFLLNRARRSDESSFIPPFFLFQPIETTAYALAESAVLTRPLEQLESLQREAQQLQVRVQFLFLAACMPDLAQQLLAAGYERAEPPLFMCCTPETLSSAPPLDGLRVAVSDSSAPLEEVRDGLEVNERGFDPSSTKQFSDEEVQEFRATLVNSRAFTAYLHDQPVAAGMYTEPFDLLTELVGITTLKPFRGRGIARAITAAMTATAFEHGIALVVLGAVDEQAARVYRQVGFRPFPVDAFWLP